MQTKDFTISIKSSEFKGKQIRTISRLWTTVKSIKTQRLKYQTRIKNVPIEDQV